MKKFTRKHYNKKLIAFGLCCFMGIGLTSTGFAAWVMSRDAALEPESGVNVAIIEDASVKITLTEGTYTQDETTKVIKLNDDFTFDAIYTDNVGRVRAQSGATEEDSEDLSVEVSGKIESAGVPYDVTAQVALPQGITNAIAAGYLAWDETNGKNYSTAQKVDVAQDGSFKFTVLLKWGEKFKGMNPCEYYDYDFSLDIEDYDPAVEGTVPLGKDVSNDDMQKELTAFWNTMTGAAEDNTATDKSYSGAFKITINATPAVVTEVTPEATPDEGQS